MASVVRLPPPDPTAAIDAVLRRLPPTQPAPHVMTEDEVETHRASALKTFVCLYYAHLKQPELPPKFQDRGAAEVQKEKAKLAERLEAAATAIKEMSRDLRRAVADLPPGENWLHPEGLAEILRTAAERTRQANIAAVPARPASYAVSSYVEAVTANAVAFFTMLTGDPPTISTNKTTKNPRKTATEKIAKTGKAAGPFVDFLTGLFAALHISTSVDSAARHAVRTMHSNSAQHHADETSLAHLHAIEDYKTWKEKNAPNG